MAALKLEIKRPRRAGSHNQLHALLCTTAYSLGKVQELLSDAEILQQGLPVRNQPFLDSLGPADCSK